MALSTKKLTAVKQSLLKIFTLNEIFQNLCFSDLKKLFVCGQKAKLQKKLYF